MKRDNEKFCQECGEIINLKAELCPKCGVRQVYNTKSPMEQQENDNKWLIIFFLCWFLGVFGVHRFYSGHIVIGVIQLLTVGGCGIWILIDLVIILSGNFKDSDGKKIPMKFN